MHTKKASIDLTHGEIVPLIIRFALPILVGQIFQNLYNSVDAIVVGRFVSTTALAAVSSSSDISGLLVGFFTGLSGGAGVLISRYFGAKDHERLSTAIHTALSFALVFGLLLSAAGIALSPLLLRMVSCPGDVWDEALRYLRVYLIGVLFTSVYNVGAGVLRAVGDSSDPFWYLVISGCANIVLDLVFVVVFRMEVMGVAAATIISQLLSMVLVLRNMMKTGDVYRVEIKKLRMDRGMLGQILSLGLPAGIQQSITGLSNLFVQGYVNRLGSFAMAGFGAAKKIDRFASMVANSIGLSSTTFISQNLGAKNEKRAYRGLLLCFIMAASVSFAVAAAVYFAAEPVSRIFTSDSQAIYFSKMMLHIMMPLYVFQVLNAMFGHSVRGFGKSRAVMVLSLLGMVGMRQLYLAIASSLSSDPRLIFYCYPVGWFFASLFVMLYFYIKIRIPYLKRVKRENAAQA